MRLTSHHAASEGDQRSWRIDSPASPASRAAAYEWRCSVPDCRAPPNNNCTTSSPSTWRRPASQHARDVSNQEHDIRLRLRVRDDLTRYWYFWGYAHYELGTTRLLRRLLERKRVFFDVGANVGYHTFLAAALLEGRGAVHAFEPWSELYEELAVNAQLNGFRSLTLSQAALGEDDGEARLFLPRTNEWTTASLVSDAPRQPFERVQTLRFDSYCRQQGIPLRGPLEDRRRRRRAPGLARHGQSAEPLAARTSSSKRWSRSQRSWTHSSPKRRTGSFASATRDWRSCGRISAEPHDRNIYLSCSRRSRGGDGRAAGRRLEAVMTTAAGNATWIELPAIGRRNWTDRNSGRALRASWRDGASSTPPRGAPEPVGTRRCISAPRATCWRARG